MKITLYSRVPDMGNEWPIVWSGHLRHRTGTRLGDFNYNIQVPQRETEAT